MKNILKAALLLAVTCTLFSACKSDKEQAREYYSAVFERTDSLLLDIQNFQNAVEKNGDGHPDECYRVLDERLSNVEQGLTKKGGYGQDDTLRQNALRLVKYYRQQCDAEFKQMTQLDFEKLDEGEREKIYIAWDSFYDNEWPLYESFDNAGRTFANRYNIFDIQVKDLTHKD